MPNFPLVLDAANLFCGADPNTDPNALSNHLTLSELKLPTMEVQYVDHRPGGAPLAVEIDVHMTRLELEFEVVGITPQIMAMLRAYETKNTLFFAYGNLRDYLGGNAMQLQAIFRGQLGKVEPRPYKRGDLFRIRYQVRGIMHYELYIGQNEHPIYRWDFYQNEFFAGDILGPFAPRFD